MRGRALAGFAAAGLALSAVPFFGPPAFYESFLYLVFHWIVLAVSWNIALRVLGLFLLRPRRVSSAPACIRPRRSRPRPAFRSCGRCRRPALVAAVFGIALGALVFRLPRLRRRALRAAHARGDFRARYGRAQHAHRRGPRALLERGAAARDRALALVHVLSARARAGARHAVDSPRDPALQARHGPLRNPRRRGRGRGAWAFRRTATSSPHSACPAGSPASRAASRPCSFPTSPWARRSRSPSRSTSC